MKPTKKPQISPKPNSEPEIEESLVTVNDQAGHPSRFRWRRAQDEDLSAPRPAQGPSRKPNTCGGGLKQHSIHVLNKSLLATAIAIACTACSKGNFSERANANHTAFVFPLSNRVTTLDPGKVQDIDMGEIIRNVFEGLVAYDEHNQIVPQLAASWHAEDGGKTYVFALRKDAKFQDGHPVRAQDFKWTFERNLSPALQSPVAENYLSPIVGVKEFVSGKAPQVSGIEVVDDSTLRLHLDKPRPYFLGLLTYPCTFVMEKEASGPKEITTVEQAVGTGPYRLAKVLETQEIDLAANPTYYLGKPLTDSIQCPVILDNSTRISKFKDGELDEISVGREDVPAIQADPKLKSEMQFQNRPALYYLYLSETSYPPFKDPRVRQAFAMAFDRNHIVDDLLSGYLEAKGILPPGIAGAQEHFQGLPYDPVAAKKLLAEAGYPGGKGLPSLELAYRQQTPDSRIACTAAATSLEQNLGVKIEPRTLDFGTLLSLRAKGRLQMVFSSWYADYLDPQNFLSMLFTSHSRLNTEGWSNPEFDRLCARADVEQDAAKRMLLYREAESIVVKDAALLPIYFQRDSVLVNPRVQGLRTNLFGDLQLNTVKISP